MLSDSAWRARAVGSDRVRLKLAGVGWRQCRLPQEFLHYQLSKHVFDEVTELLALDEKEAVVAPESDSDGARSCPCNLATFIAQCQDRSLQDIYPFVLTLPDSPCCQPRPGHFVRQLALLELNTKEYCDLPFEFTALQVLISESRKQRRSCCSPDNLRETACQTLLAYVASESNARANLVFLQLHDLEPDEKAGEIQGMVSAALSCFAKHGVDLTCRDELSVASLCFVHHFLSKRVAKRIRTKWSTTLFLTENFVPVNTDLWRSGLAMHCDVPCSFGSEDSVFSKPEHEDQLRPRAFATPPVLCQLCHCGFLGVDALKKHTSLHGGWAEYRKQVFFRLQNAPLQPLKAWQKRAMVASFSFFETHSVPQSQNDWTQRTFAEAVPRREEACVIRARLDYTENRFEAFLFAEPDVTSSMQCVYGAAEDNDSTDNDSDRSASDEETRESMKTGPLFVRQGKFCFGPAEDVRKILDVERFFNLRCHCLKHRTCHAQCKARIPEQCTPVQMRQRRVRWQAKILARKLLVLTQPNQMPRSQKVPKLRKQ